MFATKFVAVNNLRLFCAWLRRSSCLSRDCATGAENCASQASGVSMNVLEVTSNAAAKLPLTFACGLYDRMLRLYTGEVQPAGIDLKFLANDEPRDIFDRMGGKLEFDASEMSSSEFITRFGAGQSPFVAIPAFASRVFRHGFIFY